MMKRISLNIIMLTGICFTACACTENFWQDIGKVDFLSQLSSPRPWGMGGPPEDASETYKQGWEDGCKSALGAYGATHYRREEYMFQQDISRIHDPEYMEPWRSGFGHCRLYVRGWSTSNSTGGAFSFF